MTRQEHLEWCKKRAIEYVENNDLSNTWISMVNDLKKHPETKNHSAIKLGFLMFLNGHLDTQEKMRKYILGFN